MKHRLPAAQARLMGRGPDPVFPERCWARLYWAVALVLPFALLSAVSGQTASSSTDGLENGNYQYQGSFEFGYRFVNTNGSDAIYDTFVNQQQGPRLLDQTLSARSLNHQGGLFDNLFLSSFGWGGDPENASRLRMSKNKWYNFNVVFRRDQNIWDYNLLANPLNPVNPFIQVNNSPHEFLTVRRMYDYNLVLLPQSRVRFRLGFTRNNMEGPAFSSIHEGTDTLLLQNTRTLLDGYQAGIDIKLLPRTNISYDQFLQYYKGDSTWAGQPHAFQLSDGSSVDAGIVYNAPAGQPCSNTPPIFDTTTTPPTLKATCNGYQAYDRSAPTRTSYPVEQLTLQSSYFRRVDFSARGSYSSADATVNNFDESFVGLISRTFQRAFDVTGTAKNKRVVANTDLGVTVSITDRLRISDSFRFSYFRIPGESDQTTLSLFTGGAASMLIPAQPYNAAICPPTCPVHSTSSPADIATDLFNRFLGQDSKYNTIELEYDVTKRFGGHLGYRYGAREINHSVLESANELFYPTNANRGDCLTQPLNPDGTCNFSGIVDQGLTSIDVHENSGLFGVWAHPNDKLRLNFDTEIFSADVAPTRITPKNLQRYKTRANYKPRNTINLSATINILESRNNVPTVLHREHDRNYGYTVALNPNPRFGVDFGYNYDDIFSTTNICYVLASSAKTGSTDCGGAPFQEEPSLYDNKINFGYINIILKPIKRITANVGYNLVSSSGSTTILAPAPNTLGPLGLNFHKPTASVDVDLTKGIAWRTAWNYYDYNEKSDPGTLAPRDFQSNSATLSVVYSF